MIEKITPEELEKLAKEAEKGELKRRKAKEGEGEQKSFEIPEKEIEEMEKGGTEELRKTLKEIGGDYEIYDERQKGRKLREEREKK